MPVWLRGGVLLLAVAALLTVIVCLLVYVAQARLIFYPRPLNESAARTLQRTFPRSEGFELATDDGALLHGWMVRGPAQGSWPLIIYYGGNAEEISWLLPEFSRMPDWAALLVNYRGYGLSQGRPSEAALYRDALAIYDHSLRRAEVDRHRVVLIGRSLGTGIATYVASQRTVAGVVLISPYDSLAAVARDAYPFLPVGLLLRHRFESGHRAPNIHAPMLALVAAQDTLIRPERSRRLVQAWGGTARLEVLNGADHNNIHLHPNYWPLISGFLQQRADAVP
jgi:pimeloyl-ACP methyl ester carboxylesterase